MRNGLNYVLTNPIPLEDTQVTTRDHLTRKVTIPMEDNSGV